MKMLLEDKMETEVSIVTVTDAKAQILKIPSSIIISSTASSTSVTPAASSSASAIKITTSTATTTHQKPATEKKKKKKKEVEFPATDIRELKKAAAKVEAAAPPTAEAAAPTSAAAAEKEARALGWNYTKRMTPPLPFSLTTTVSGRATPRDF